MIKAIEQIQNDIPEKDIKAVIETMKKIGININSDELVAPLTK